MTSPSLTSEMNKETIPFPKAATPKCRLKTYPRPDQYLLTPVKAEHSRSISTVTVSIKTRWPHSDSLRVCTTSLLSGLDLRRLTSASDQVVTKLRLSLLYSEAAAT